MYTKTIERIENSNLYDKFLWITEKLWIIAIVTWFTLTFGDGLLWVIIFEAGFYLGTLYK